MLQQYIRTIVSVQIVAVCFSNGFDSHCCKAVRSKNDLHPLFKQSVQKKPLFPLLQQFVRKVD
jgi:hypothetical protein